MKDLSDKDFTLIMPLYNGAEFIERTVKSIAQQTYLDKMEIIVLEDNSSDGSRDILEDCSEKYSVPMTIFFPPSNEHLGYSFSQRILYRKIETPFWAYLAFSDYWCEPDHVERGVRFLKDHPDFVMYASNYYNEFQDGERIPLRNPNFENVSLERFASSFFPMTWASASVMYRNFWTPELFDYVESLAGDCKIHFSDADAFCNFAATHYGKSYFDNIPNAVYSKGSGISSGINNNVDATVECIHCYLGLVKFEQNFFEVKNMTHPLLQSVVNAYVVLAYECFQALRYLSARSLPLSKINRYCLNVESDEDVAPALFKYLLQLNDELVALGVKIEEEVEMDMLSKNSGGGYMI